jgi:hypothetical protein
MQNDRSSKARSEGTGMYSVNPSESTTLRDADPESQKNALLSIEESIEKEYNPYDAKEESQITGITFPDGGWRAWSVVFGVKSFP